ncbi:hypothetical protein [Haloarcula nitratireducens]|uniref:Pectate lyase superfamily protein domain-containing protein n=1 Tax=Haloarcula nitratireducens TaxID=2487749 RepID=A0AAW4PCQ6_9EURY|nr:hypothetical protein [Halomicroarcula nitratireducens]MBX0295757.1 hypothetical protein [Halomicroarcula nitratireducens]
MNNPKGGRGGNSSIGRRTFLAGVGAAVGAAATSGTASAYHDSYDPVNVVEAGAANDGSESITGVLEDLVSGEDDISLYFPPGEYLMDEQLRHTGFESFAMFGDDATIRPAPADEFDGPARLFKLGTSYSPGDWARVQNIDFDFTESNTGLRALQIQCNDLYARNVHVRGQHDTGTWGPYQFDVVDPDEIAVVKNVTALDGGEYSENTPNDHYPSPVGGGGPTGIIVSPAHEGRIWFKHCELGGFPDNGLYSSAEDGEIMVYGGSYRNSNVANIRLDGPLGYIKHAEVVVDESRDLDGNQRGIRLDSGDDFWVYDTDIEMESATGDAIRVTNSANNTTIQEVSITVDDDDGAEDAISVSPSAGEVTIFDSEIEMRAGGTAIDLKASDDDVPALVEDVTITGDADGGYGGSHAIRCERDESRFYDLTVDQPGDDYRRCITITGDDCIVAFGEYRSTHHPIINNAEDTAILDLEAEAYNGQEAIKLYEAEDVSIYDCVLYNGITNPSGNDDFATFDNSYPDN